MKKNILISFILFQFVLSASKVVFYNTYEDFKNQTGQNKGEFLQFSITENHTNLQVIEENKDKHTFKFKDLEKLWAVKIDSVLFRCSNGLLFEVLHLGNKISIFENAHNRVEAFNEGKSYTPGQINHTMIYFSKGNDGSIEFLSTNVKGHIKEELKLKYQEFGNLFKDLETHYHEKHQHTTQKIIETIKQFDLNAN